MNAANQEERSSPVKQIKIFEQDDESAWNLTSKLKSGVKNISYLIMV